MYIWRLGDIHNGRWKLTFWWNKSGFEE